MCSALVRAGGASRSWSRLALAAALLVAATPAARSMTLVEALEAARAHDPQYRSAAYELEAARQGVPIARAALMPVAVRVVDLGLSRALRRSDSVRVNHAGALVGRSCI